MMRPERVDRKTKIQRFPLFATVSLAVILALFAALTGRLDGHTAAGACFWYAFVMAVYEFRPGSWVNSFPASEDSLRHTLITLAAEILLILACILPMSLSPIWNGEVPDHRNEYEVMADSLLEGHLYLDYDDIDPKLLAMENPYDPEARKAAGVSVHWDHAWYNGHYYMYFGVVPAVLTFLPYRILTGHALTTYHATQLYVMLMILGFFALFQELADRFYKRLPFGTYLLLSAASGAISSWYCAEAPALYCTAISAGLCLQVWSIYFFARAAFTIKAGKKRVRWAVLGALLGSLAFGCRPPVALGNLLALGMLVPCLKGHRPSARLFRVLFTVFLPYILVGAALMWYNYARFDNPFEFGQTYQMTVADQHLYSTASFRLAPGKALQAIAGNFFGFGGVSDTFPYISFSGAFLNFPVFFLVLNLLDRDVLRGVRKDGLSGTLLCLAVMPLLVTALDAAWTPFLMERYRLDIYYLLSILTFIAVAAAHRDKEERGARRVLWAADILGVLALLGSFLLFLVPNDCNIAALYPEISDSMRRIILFF
ncbi:MAG: hypothetical protein PUE04_09380 [Lachnospira sp.]|nr:hypothetical protein [Lachnospira sp.]